MSLDPGRLAFVEGLPIAGKGHRGIGPKMCTLEQLSYVAGEGHSDSPECACPVLSAFVRALNDRLPHGQRQELSRYVRLLYGTRGSGQDETDRRALIRAWHERTGQRLSRGRAQRAIDECTVLALSGQTRSVLRRTRLSRRALSAIHALLDDLIAVTGSGAVPHPHSGAGRGTVDGADAAPIPPDAMGQDRATAPGSTGQDNGTRQGTAPPLPRAPERTGQPVAPSFAPPVAPGAVPLPDEAGEPFEAAPVPSHERRMPRPVAAPGGQRTARPRTVARRRSPARRTGATTGGGPWRQ